MPTDSDHESTLFVSGDEPFPAKRVLFAALLPALFGLIVGLFIVPPQIGYDAAAGLRAWINFTNGGTWNTIAIPDPNNIAQTVEIAVTWWPPGQYLFLGLLSSAGLSFAHAALLLTFFCSLSGSIGSAVLARELGAPARSLLWVGVAVACTPRNLAGFHGYWNGEPLIMALWPWVAAIAWRFRNRNIILILTLPILFLIGSYIKYSFATYAICILLFLWSERLMSLDLKGAWSLSQKVRDVLRSSFPLIAIGVLYIIGRHYFIGSEGSPLQGWGQGYSLREILAYTPIMPFTAVADLQDSLVHCIAQLSGRNYREAWMLTASCLVYMSPSVIILYVCLIAQKRPALRFLGITAFVTVVIFSIFYISGYAIGMRERYYQQAAILLLIATAAYGTENRRLFRLIQVFMAGIMIVGIFKFTRTTHAHLKDDSIMHVGSYGFSVGFPPSLVKEIQSIAKESNTVIAIPSPVLALEIDSDINPSTHILPTYGRGITTTYRGRVSQVSIVEPVGSSRNIKARFVDYAEGEWSCHVVDDWVVWQTGASAKGSSIKVVGEQWPAKRRSLK